MSGVGALWHLDGRPIAAATTDRLLDALAHRGPGVATWREHDVALVHRTRSTSPEPSREAGLFAGLLPRGAVAADVRIDNRDELIASLLPRGNHHGPGPSDAALISLAWQRWGERCPEHLVGDFAFAIWDARRRVLFCARDPFGVKPLCFHFRHRRLFAAASEAEALLAIDGVPQVLDETRVGDFLTRTFEDRSSTYFRGIQRLPPAHSLLVSVDGFVLRRHWSLEPSRRVHCSKDADYAEAFSEIFGEAVRCRLRGSQSVGCMLSGGLDSSSIACVAADSVRRSGHPRPDAGPLPTFSEIFEESRGSDEREFIRAVLARGGFDPAWIQGDRVAPLGGLADVLPRLDGPPFAENLALTAASFRTAAARGVGIILDGLHGDNTVSHGELHLAELLRGGRVPGLVRALRAHGKHGHGRPWPTLRDHALRPNLPPGLLAAWRTVRRRPPTTARPHLLRGDPTRARKLEARRAALHARFHEPFRDARRVHALELDAGITVSTLEAADRLAADAGLECRFPFLDRRLVEFCLAVPSEQKFLEGRPRSLLRRAMAGVLPEEVRLRTDKRGTAAWLVRGLAGPDRESVEALRVDAFGELERWLEPSALAEARRRFLAKPDYASARVLWEPLALAAWLERGTRSKGTPTTRGGDAATQLAPPFTAALARKG